jgi:hypothetical protein
MSGTEEMGLRVECLSESVVIFIVKRGIINRESSNLFSTSASELAELIREGDRFTNFNEGAKVCG